MRQAFFIWATMTSDLRIQGEVVVNSEQAEGAFNRVGDKAQQMANTVATSAGKAGQAVDKIGDGAGASAEKFTRAESRISASIKRATNELELLGKTASQRLEFNIADKGLDAAKFEPALKKLREVEAQALQAQRAATGSLDKMGISAAQTAAALRGVPAQFTDIVTSLQGGQAPLTVFLQQGGQLKDMFGGAGNAARALGGYVVGLINPFTLAAAAVVGLGIAMANVNSIDAEFAGLSTRLAATGRASVASIEGLRSMVDELNKVPGVSRSAATSIIDEFSKVQGVGGAIFKGLGASVAEFAAATGTDLPAAAKKLAGAFADPAKGVRELESALGTLTAEQILTIESMAAMGDKAGAQAAMLDALKQAVGGVGGPMTDLGKATDRLSNSWDSLVHSFSQSEGLRTINTLLSGVIDKFTWLLNNAPSSMFGPLGYMAGQAAAAANRLSISYVPPEFNTPQGGSGRGTVNPAFAVNSNEQVNAALEVTKGIESQASALQKLREKSDLAKAALKELEGQNKGNSLSAQQLRSAIGGLNEQIEAARKNAGAAGAAAAKAEQTAYAGLVSGIRASIEAKRLELAGGDKLTESKRIQIKFDQDLLSGKLKLSNVSKAKTQADIDELARVERALQVEKQRLQTQTAIADQADQAQMEWAQYQDQSARAYRSQVEGANEALRIAQEANGLIALEASMVGLSNKERQVAIEYRRIELKLAQDISEIEKSSLQDFEKKSLIATRERTAAAEREGVVLRANMTEQQDILNSIDRTAQQVWTNVFEGGQDAFTKLGKTLKAAVLDMLYQMTLKKWIISVGASVTGSGAMAGGGGSGGGNPLGNINSLFGAASQYLTGASAGASSASLFGANLVGMGGGDALGALIAGNGGWAGVSTGVGGMSAAAVAAMDLAAGNAAIGSALGFGSASASAAASAASAAGAATATSTAAAGIGSTLSSFAAAAGPWVAAAMAIYSLVSKFDTSGTPHVGSMAQYSEAGGLNTSQTHGAFGMGFGGVDYNESAATLVSGVSRTVVGILDSVSRSFGGKGGFTVSTGFADDSSNDGAWGGLLIEQFGQALVNWDTSRTGKWAPRVFADGEAGQREYLAALAQDVTGVLREMDLPGWAQDTLTALGNSPSLESLATAIDQINSTKAALDTMGKNLVGFAGYSDAAASALIKASGGISALAANASAYYENFYTEAERQANATRDVTAALAAVNIALPASRDAYRALVEQYTAMGTAGASTLAVLLGLSGAFAAITPAADAAAAAIGETLAEAITRLRNPERSVEDIARNTISLEDRLAQVQNAGNTAALRERELRGLTAAEAALQRRIWLLEDEARVTSERDGLELQYLQLMGDTAAIRARERAALDESNRALYDRINAINDERAAAEAAAEAAAQAVSDMLGKANISAASMADIIRDGMLGRMSQEDVGAKLTEMIVGGINNALASRFADQISTLFIDSIITPMLTAVTTGGSISTAVSQSSIDAVIASATAAAANMAAIFNDPYWQAAMDAINTAIRGVSGAVARPASPAASADNSSWMAANEASYQAAQDAKKAWQGVGDTILDEVKRIRGEMVGGTAQSMSNAQAQFAIATAQARSGDQEAAKSLPGLSQALLTIAEAQASSTLELRRIQAATAASLELTNSEIAKKFGLQVPSYDVGTNYVPQDMLAMVHEGEAIVPRAFNPALAGGTSSNSNADLVAEVRALRAQVALLQAPTESIERNTKRTAQDLDDVTRNGMPVINQPDTELATA